MKVALFVKNKGREVRVQKFCKDCKWYEMPQRECLFLGKKGPFQWACKSFREAACDIPEKS